MVLEKIKCSAPVSANRSVASKGTGITTYMHMLLNQRTVPLGLSYPACGNRTDGWCDYDTFLESLQPANIVRWPIIPMLALEIVVPFHMEALRMELQCKSFYSL